MSHSIMKWNEIDQLSSMHGFVKIMGGPSLLKIINRSNCPEDLELRDKIKGKRQRQS